jgi:hypothetical protein
MTRLELLIAHAAAARARRFRWGRHDCVRFTAAWVKTCTGQDLLAPHRYASRREAMALMAELGAGSPADLAARHLAEIAPALAQVGDLAEVDGALGIVAGEAIYVLTARGLGLVPLTRARRAFRIGDVRADDLRTHALKDSA